MEQVKNCKQTGCNVREDGKCLEGLETGECPHFYFSDSEDDEPDADEPADDDSTPPKVTFFDGEELGIDQIEIVSNRFNPILVLILGEFDCGKTTLLASIFDLFQTGYFKKLSFAGSLTQIGFEHRSHLSREASGSENPDTERTKYLEFRLLHLAVQRVSDLCRRHLLLSDISGETIRQARNSGSVMATKLSLVKSADFIFYMIDGAKLCSHERAAVVLHATLFVQSALDNGVFSADTILNILIAKWDVVASNDADNPVEMLKRTLAERFDSKVSRIVYFEIAARPGDTVATVEMGHGLESFLEHLMSGSERVRDRKVNISPERSSRNFQNFKVK